jgi:hypothetical protein
MNRGTVRLAQEQIADLWRAARIPGTPVEVKGILRLARKETREWFADQNTALDARSTAVLRSPG